MDYLRSQRAYDHQRELLTEAQRERLARASRPAKKPSSSTVLQISRRLAGLLRSAHRALHAGEPRVA